MKLLTVCGPTACGKTRLAVAMARRLGADIISADSRQVYRGLDLGTGKDLAEYSQGGKPVRCHLIDVAEPDQVFSLYLYQQAVYRLLADWEGIRPCAVLCGGTGLYVEAILRQYRIHQLPEDPVLHARLMTRSKQSLEEELRRDFPGMAQRTDCSTKKRVARALEVALRSGDHPPRTSGPCPVPLESLVYVICPERSVIHRRIEERLDRRLREGMVEEVRRLLEAGLPEARLKALGMEYRHITAYLAGETDWQTMRDTLFWNIRDMAKRQETWFRGMARRGLPVHWVSDPDQWDWEASLRQAGW